MIILPILFIRTNSVFGGLMDSEGVCLPAVFSRDGDFFTCVPDEVVTFSPDEGFELQAFCDLDV